MVALKIYLRACHLGRAHVGMHTTPHTRWGAVQHITYITQITCLIH